MEMQRDQLLAHLAAKIPQSTNDCILVAVDGRDGAGKTVFADDLAETCRRTIAPQIIRISLDDFHNTRDERYRLGPKSPEGFFHDSYDYQRFKRGVLEPLGPGGSRRYRERSHDLATDRILDDEPEREAKPGAVVIVDGMFLHRPELVEAWTMSIYLHVSAEICAQRMLLRDGSAPDLVPTDRYFGGQMMYLEACRPVDRAHFVVDNSRLDVAVLVTGGIV
jgi:uridine kinase